MVLRNNIILSFVVALFVLSVDQVTKFFIKKNMPLYSTKVVIPHFLNLVHIKNKGIAFGLFNGPSPFISYFLSIISLIAVVFVIYLLVTEGRKGPFVSTCLGMILGGAIGNLLDRFLFGEVTDFIDVYFRNYHWPAFNVADMAISIGGFLFVFCVFLKKTDN